MTDYGLCNLCKARSFYGIDENGKQIDSSCPNCNGKGFIIPSDCNKKFDKKKNKTALKMAIEKIITYSKVNKL